MSVIDQIVQPLRDRRKELEEEVQGLGTRLRLVKEEAATIDRMLAMAEGRQNGRAATGPKKKRPYKTARVSMERELQVQLYLEEHGNGPLTVRQIADALGWKFSTTGTAVSQARQRGLIRLVGRDETTQGKPRTFVAVS